TSASRSPQAVPSDPSVVSPPQDAARIARKTRGERGARMSQKSMLGSARRQPRRTLDLSHPPSGPLHEPTTAHPVAHRPPWVLFCAHVARRLVDTATCIDATLGSRHA